MEILGIASGAASGIGALGFGLLADLVGRRKAFLAAGTVACVSGVASSFAWDFLSLVLLRIVVSFGVGGNMVCAVTMLSEHLPCTVRQPCLALMQIPWKAGGMFCIALASHFMPSPQSANWHTFVLLTNIPYALILVCILLQPALLPESPSFLWHQGKEEQVTLYFQRLDSSRKVSQCCCRNAEECSKFTDLKSRSNDVSSSSTPVVIPDSTSIKGSGAGSAEQTAHPPKKRTIGGFLQEFCANRYLLAITLCCTCLWFGAMVGSGVQMWLPEILSRVGMSTQHAYRMLILASFVEISSFLTVALLLHFFKGHMLLPAFLLCATATSAAMMALGAQETLFAFVVATCSWFYFYGACWPLMYSTTPDYFPATHRAAGFGLCSTSSKLASVLHPIIAGHLLDRSVRWTLASYAGGWMLAAVAAFIVGLFKSLSHPGQQSKDSAAIVPPRANSHSYLVLKPECTPQVHPSAKEIGVVTEDDDGGVDCTPG